MLEIVLKEKWIDLLLQMIYTFLRFSEADAVKFHCNTTDVKAENKT